MAAVAGAAMALQGTFNTAAGKVIGIGENTLLVHLIGAATMALILLLVLEKAIGRRLRRFRGTDTSAEFSVQ